MASYKVSLVYPAGPGRASQTERDITESVVGVPLVTDTGGLETNSAELVLNSPRGEFLTVDPVIEDFDHFRVELTDDDGNTYDREFQYMPQDGAMKIDETAATGRLITLNLLGIEAHLQRVNYLGIHRWSDPHTVARAILKDYNSNKGAGQPEVDEDDAARTDGMNRLPVHTSNTYAYAETALACWDRLQQVVTSLGAPPADGGLLDFFTHSYETGGSEYNKLTFKSHSLGSTPDAPVVITEGVLSSAEDDRETGKSPAEATRVIGFFERDAGTLPVDFQKFQGLVERHSNLPYWRRDVAYRRGEQVRFPLPGQNVGDPRLPVFEAITDTAAGTPPNTTTAWRQISYQQFVGTVQYSPWTDDKRETWINMGADPTSSGFLQRSMPDFNRAVVLQDYFSVPVDAVATRMEDVPAQILFPGRRPYKGLTVLVNGTGDGAFAGFSNQIVIHDGTRWRTKYRIESDTNNAFAVDYSGGNTYVCTGGTWSRTGYGDAAQSMHLYDSIENVQGIVPSSHTDGMATNQRSAIEVTYRSLALSGDDLQRLFQQGPTAAEIDYADYTGSDTIRSKYYTWVRDEEGRFRVVRGAGEAKHNAATLRLAFPFPVSTYNGIGEDVGELYGALPDPVTIDAVNNAVTPDGNRGFNHADSEALGRLGSLDFGIKLDRRRITAGVVGNLIDEANFRIRCCLRDIWDRLVIQDFTLNFHDKWEVVSLPLSGFTPYVPVRPESSAAIRAFVPPQQVEALDLFDWHNIKDITWTDISQHYDEHGRFEPLDWRSEEVRAFDVVGDAVALVRTLLAAFLEGVEVVADAVTGDFIEIPDVDKNGTQTKLAIDAPRFSKELVVTSPPTSETGGSWNLEKTLRVPGISVDSQARSYVRSAEELHRFPKHDFVIDVRGRFDIRYGDSFLYKNEAVIHPDLAEAGSPGTIKLAAYHVEHSFTDRGELRTRIWAGRRFT